MGLGLLTIISSSFAALSRAKQPTLQLNMLCYFPTRDISFTEAWWKVYPAAARVPLKPASWRHMGTTSSSAWWFDDAEWVNWCVTMHGPVQVDMDGTCFHSSCRVTVRDPPKADQSSYPRPGFPEHGLYTPKALMMVTFISLFRRRLPVHYIPQHFPQNTRNICRVRVSTNPCEGWRALCPSFLWGF